MFDIPGDAVQVIIFAVLAIASIAGAVGVIAAKDPFHSALSLIVNFVSLGALYLLLQGPFVAVSQIIVYAGAVVVLFLFVIAYLGDRRELVGTASRAALALPAGVLAGLVLFGVLAYVVLSADYQAAAHVSFSDPDGFAFGSVKSLGKSFLTKYILEFEVTSIVLLVAAIGGIVLGLTGRSRHDRLREMLGTTSADQHKRKFRAIIEGQQERAHAEGGGRHPGAEVPAKHRRGQESEYVWAGSDDKEEG